MKKASKHDIMTTSFNLSTVFEDPIDFEIMVDAVITTCGHSFSLESIQDWLLSNNTCPLCNEPLETNNPNELPYKPNYALRRAIDKYVTTKNEIQQQQNHLPNEDLSSDDIHDMILNAKNLNLDDWDTINNVNDTEIQNNQDTQLIVDVKEARNLKKKDIFGLSDPYCVLEMGRTRKKTSVIKNTLNPVWEENFIFQANHVDHPTLIIRVFDKDRITKDSFLGRVQISFKQIQEKKNFSDWYPLQKRSPKSNVSGDIFIHFKLIDLNAIEQADQLQQNIRSTIIRTSSQNSPKITKKKKSQKKLKAKSMDSISVKKKPSTNQKRARGVNVNYISQQQIELPPEKKEEKKEQEKQNFYSLSDSDSEEDWNYSWQAEENKVDLVDSSGSRSEEKEKNSKKEKNNLLEVGEPPRRGPSIDMGQEIEAQTLKYLVGFGFSGPLCRYALLLADHNRETALDLLLQNHEKLQAELLKKMG